MHMVLFDSRIGDLMNWLRKLCTVALAALVMGCGGGGEGGSFAPNPDGGGGNGGGTGGGTGTTDPTVAAIGAIIDDVFVQGQILIAVPELSAGGMTDVTVNFRDSNGDPASQDITVTFTSGCVADGTASFAIPDVTTVNGQARAEYTAAGCVGNDEIRATATADGTNFTAIGVVAVAADPIASIEFLAADPSTIALAGTGGTEASRVSFRVLGESGEPISGAEVVFSLNSTTGGLTLSPTSAFSNTVGEVSTVVNAGTVATTVRVTATEQSTGQATQSSGLAVSTGIPDSDSFSLSADTLNPEASDFDGVTVDFTIRAADAFNNPVPDGTTISFYAEGGAIAPSCATAGGSCPVTWTSQNPRPDDRRVSILATAIGNESFTDANGNGLFDDGEAFTDLGEAFADENENGVYDLGEFFIDFGPNGTPDGVRNGPDGRYTGVLCAPTASTCSNLASVIVSEELVITMSSITPGERILLDVPTTTLLEDGDDIPAIGTDSRELEIVLVDDFGNSLPFGTSFQVTVTEGYSLSGATTGTVPNSEDVETREFTISRTETANRPDTGKLTVTIQAPTGTPSSFVYDVSDT